MSNFLWTSHFWDLPDFQEFRGMINDSLQKAVHKFTVYCVQWSRVLPIDLHTEIALTRIYNPGMSLALRFLM